MKFQTKLLMTAAALPLWHGTAWAQSEATAQIADGTTQTYEAARAADPGEIVVTARKRAERIQDVPIAVTVAGEEAIARNFITRVEDVQTIAPNVSLQSLSTVRGTLVAYIRGIGTRLPEPTQDPAIAISVDGVYLASTVASALDLFDVSQIEVLRGPQGTLQGRNSPAGAINIRTRRPGDEFAVRAEASYARFNTVSLKGVVDVPVVPDLLAVKFGGVYSHSDGFVRYLDDNSHAGKVNTYIGRVGVLLTPSSDITLYLTGEYTRDRSLPPPTRGIPITGTRLAGVLGRTPSRFCTDLVDLGQCFDRPRYTATADIRDKSDIRVWFGTANLDWDLGPVTLTSVTGYRDTKEVTAIDADASNLPLVIIRDRTINLDQFTQEVRLSSNRSGAPVGGDLRWTVGGYYLNTSFVANDPSLAFGAQSRRFQRAQTTKSYAVFGQATFNINDAWSVSGGARQSWDEKDLVLTFRNPTTVNPRSASFKNFSVEGGTEYKITQDILTYFRYAQGYRAGGINGQVSFEEAINPYGPESVDSFEIGAKTEFLDRTLLANIALFRSKYKDIQRDTVIPISVPPLVTQIVQNRGSATIKGAELELKMRPGRYFNVGANFAILDAKRDETGEQLPFVSKYSGNVSFDYEIPLSSAGNLVLGADLEWRSDYLANSDPISIQQQDGYELANASLTYNTPDERISVTGFVRNIFNSYYFTSVETGVGLNAFASEGEPRTYGVRVTAKF